MRLLVLAWAVGGALLAQAPVSRYDVGKAAAKPSAAGADREDDRCAAELGAGAGGG
jgi:hypothetical protein